MRMRDNEDDDRRGRQGQVTRSSDQRLRGQESEAIYKSRRRGDDGRGRVTDPEHDHRLSGHRNFGSSL